MDLLIVGATARAAAFSAVRAGWSPMAVDRFADRDLAAVARCARVDAADEPAGLIEAAGRFPDAPWMYTGALENQPAVIDALAARRLLLGNSGAVVRRVRDPWLVAEALGAAGLACPEVRATPRDLPRDGTWLAKPRASGGGIGVVPLRDRVEPSHRTHDRAAVARGWGSVQRRSEATEPADSNGGLAFDVDQPDRYYQRRCAGRPVSAVFLAVDGRAALVGMTQQLTGLTGAPFAYRGSLGPLEVGPEIMPRVGEVGRVLASAFELVGLFGVDLILGSDGVPWPVEVNPRYTASVEVIELFGRRALLPAHRAACEGDMSALERLAVGGAPVVAKEVVFAPGPSVFDHDAIDLARHDPAAFEVPDAADIPAPGTRFEYGDPVLTVFAQGRSTDESLRHLAQARRKALRLLRPLTDS